MAGAGNVDRDVSSLRNSINWLISEKDIIASEKEVDPDLEITALQKKLDGGLGLLFHNVKRYPHIQAVTNIFANRFHFSKILCSTQPLPQILV